MDSYQTAEQVSHVGNVDLQSPVQFPVWMITLRKCSDFYDFVLNKLYYRLILLEMNSKYEGNNFVFQLVVKFKSNNLFICNTLNALKLDLRVLYTSGF